MTFGDKSILHIKFKKAEITFECNESWDTPQVPYFSDNSPLTLALTQTQNMQESE